MFQIIAFEIHVLPKGEYRIHSFILVNLNTRINDFVVSII